MSSTGADTPASGDAPISPPLVELEIETHDRGFYDGFSREVTIPAKIIVSLIILWAIFFPVRAMETLAVANSTIISAFSGWYVYLVAFLVISSAVIVLCLLYTSPSPRDLSTSRMPSSA